MSFSSWFNSLTAALMPAKEITRDVPRVADAILTELSCQVRLAEEQELQAERERKRIQMGGIDYSWLVTVKPKMYEVPEIEKLELEELCGKILPEECSTVIQLFRDAILRGRKAQEMPGILRAVIHQVIDTRPESSLSGGGGGGMPQWLSKSLSSLRSLHMNIRNNAVSAADISSMDLEKQERSPSVELTTLRSHCVKF